MFSNRVKTLNQKLDETLALLEDSRLHASLVAYKELQELQRQNESSLHTSEGREFTNRLQMSKQNLDLMIERVKETDEVLATWSVGSESDWTLGSENNDVTTHYKTSAEGILTVRIASTAYLPVFEQIAVVNEVDLWKRWIPFCSISDLIVKTGHAELLAFIKTSAPFMSRDTALHAYGVDCLTEKNLILLMARSVLTFPGYTLPYEAPTWTHNRVDIKNWKTLIEVKSPVEAKMTMIMTIDLNCPLPNWLINFVVRNVAGVLLHCLQKQVRITVDDPLNMYGQRIRQNKEFYTNWLYRKLKAYCEHTKIPMPPIASFADTLFEADRQVALSEKSDQNSSECCSCSCWGFGADTSVDTKKSDQFDQDIISQKRQIEETTIALSSQKEKNEPYRQIPFLYIGVFCLLLMLGLHLGLFGVGK